MMRTEKSSLKTTRSAMASDTITTSIAEETGNAFSAGDNRTVKNERSRLNIFLFSSLIFIFFSIYFSLFYF